MYECIFDYFLNSIYLHLICQNFLQSTLCIFDNHSKTFKEKNDVARKERSEKKNKAHDEIMELKNSLPPNSKTFEDLQDIIGTLVKYEM